MKKKTPLRIPSNGVVEYQATGGWFSKAVIGTTDPDVEPNDVVGHNKYTREPVKLHWSTDRWKQVV